ncbi:MAG: hypothetical protein J7L15_06345 [Clostridiales bacterium]|nr:hypothetical protein [Clostridiales bacterium]
MKKYRLYLDDIRDPKGEFDFIARTSNEAIRIMESQDCPTFISFDHDLGGDDTAMKVVKYMINEDLDQKGEFIPEDFTFFVHSANPVGAANITGYINAYLKQKENK